MAKKCPNCKSEISRYQPFCYQCGQEIQHVSKRPKHDWGIEWKWFLFGMLLPPLGVLWFFLFPSNNPSAASSAIKGAVFSTVLSFVFWRVIIWFIPVEPDPESGFVLLRLIAPYSIR